MNEASCAFQVIYETLKEDKTLSVSAMCEIAGVSRSGYYAWLKAASVREEREEQETPKCRDIPARASQSARTASAKRGGIEVRPLKKLKIALTLIEQ